VQITKGQNKTFLDPIIVVETRTPISLMDSSPWVTRISGEDLEKRQIFSLADALRTVPGMAIVRTGQFGAQTSAFSRGSESNHLTYLYEGRKLNGGFSGSYNLGELSTLGSSSVEILRGSSSNLYGAHAMGGSVYLRNEFLESDGVSSQLNFAAGGFGSLNTGYRSFIKKGEWAANFNLMTLETDNDRPNSKFENLSSSFHFQKEMPNDWSINLLGLGYQSDFGVVGSKYSPSLTNFQETAQYLLSPQIKINTEDWNFMVNYSFSDDELYYYSPTYQTISWTEQEDVDALLNVMNSEIFSFQLGLTYSTQRFRQDGLQPASMWGPKVEWDRGDSWEQVSSFVSVNYLFSENTEIETSVRYDDYSDFGSPTTVNFQFKNSINENLNVYSRFSTGYAPPTALELYGIDGRTGNLNLISEKSENFELGLKLQSDDRTNNLQISYFYTNYENLISGYPLAVNINESKVSGLEISYKSKLNERIDLFSSFTYLKAKNEDTGEEFLDRRPEFLGSVVLTYTNESFSLGTELNTKFNTKEKDWGDWASPTYGSYVEADDYAIVGIFSNYQVTEGFEIHSRIDNVFDEKYEEVDGYPALGINANAGIRYSF
jgi:vitamin B12 transporter